MSAERNPYAAPAPAAVEVSFLRDQPRPPRPIAVWLMLLFLSGFTVLLGLTSARLLWNLFAHRGADQDGLPVALAIAVSTVAPAGLLWTGFAAYSRRAWSRWVGLALILAYAAFGILKPDTTHYVNETQRAGGHVARTFIIPLLCAWWCYAFAFSVKARRYFAKPVAEQD